jgi:hypothetical protein
MNKARKFSGAATNQPFIESFNRFMFICCKFNDDSQTATATTLPTYQTYILEKRETLPFTSTIMYMSP